MIKFLEPVDYEKLYVESVGHPILCDEKLLNTNSAINYLKLLFQNNNTKNLDFVASCECGALEGNYWIGAKCHECKTIVDTSFYALNDFNAWFEIPDFLPPVLHPVAYRYIKNFLKNYDKKSILDLLLDIETTELPPELQGTMGIGMNYFYENFDDIMNYFINIHPKFKKNPMAKEIELFINLYRDRLFVRHLPILNKSLHLLTSSGQLTYSDSSSPHFVETLVELSNLTFSFKHRPRSIEYVDKHLNMIYNSYLEYVDSVITKKLISKKGLIRQQLFGSRLHNTQRGVIVPITEVHDGDEIHIPWKMGVTMNKLEIINILMTRYHYTLPDALEKFEKSILNYDKDVDDILKILIKECPYKGLVVILNRNPSIRLSALQLVFCTKIKTDLSDDTVSISSLVIHGPNARV